jgi:crotonobetainyl-CoA:carnitine CoA-transferase CaiB-like acyl-CoA transferase
MAMDYPNPLHWDQEFAHDSKFGGLIAPQSIAVGLDYGHGVAPACVGYIPGSHLIFGGEEWWFYGCPVRVGDKLFQERRFHDYKVVDTKFSPPLGPAAYPRAVAPNRKPYRTKDGHISALVYNDKQWSAFINAVKPAWAGEHFATLEQRAREVDTVYALLGETFLKRTTQDWLELLRSLDIPAAPVHTLDELFDNPHLNAVGFFETVDTPNGPVRFPGTPTWFSRTPGRIAGPAPRLGAHTQQIMGELGMAAGGEG